MNIQQPTTSELAYKATVMAYNEDLVPPLPHDISNLFSSADLFYKSSYDSAKYRLASYRARVIRSFILSSGESPEACSRALSIALNHKQISSILAVTGAILPKIYSNLITQHEQKKKYCPMQHLLVIDKKKEYRFFLSYPILL